MRDLLLHRVCCGCVSRMMAWISQELHNHIVIVGVSATYTLIAFYNSDRSTDGPCISI